MYRAITHDIEVTVAPSFLPEHSSPDTCRYVWAYAIEITNHSRDTVRLRSRHWVITDANGHIEEVRGAGVVGEQPTLTPGEVYRYTSGCPLSTTSGIMVGQYEMERETGERFMVDVPPFSLDLPDSLRTVH